MIEEPLPAVAFLLVAFAVFAVPTTVAYVLFGLLRREETKRAVVSVKPKMNRIRLSRMSDE